MGDPPNTIEHYVNSGIIRELKKLGNVVCLDTPGNRR